MTHAEALRLVAMLTAYFRQELSNETAMLWAHEIQHFSLEDGMEAARTLGLMDRFMPSLAEFCDAITDERNTRLKRERPVLPPVEYRAGDYCTAEQFLRARPEMAERVKKLGVWKDLLKKIDQETA